MPKPIGVGVVVANVVVSLYRGGCSCGTGTVERIGMVFDILVIQWRHPAHYNVFLA